MINIDTFISDYITHRKESLFAEDMQRHRESLQKEIVFNSIIILFI